MPYDYLIERPAVFSEDGQIMFLSIRDNAKRLFSIAGAARLQEIIAKQTGSSWKALACVDRLVELGEIREIVQQGHVAGQDRVFVSAR